MSDEYKGKPGDFRVTFPDGTVKDYPAPELSAKDFPVGTRVDLVPYPNCDPDLRHAPAVPDDVAAVVAQLKDTPHNVRFSRRAADIIEAQAAELARLRPDGLNWTTCGIVEIAARNPSVMEYMAHWEGRAEAAEAELARLRDAHTAAQPAPDAVAEALREAYEAGWHMTEAFCVHEDSYQMAAAERLENALTALRDAIPEVDQPAAKGPSA